MRKSLVIVLLIFLLSATVSQGQNIKQIRGWNISSGSYEDELVTIHASSSYNINHLQLSHKILMNLNEIKQPEKQKRVNDLISKAHTAGIQEVVLWDHSLYNLEYYPDQFKTGPNHSIDLDNPEFWRWFKQDYRDMMKLVPNADGLVLTFIETGARAENQYSEKLKTAAEKLAVVVDAVASVVCDELGKQLYIRTFAYTDAEYANTIGCIEHIKNNKIILMMKETPHDFFLTHPNNKYIGTLDRPTIVEFDTSNEFNGQGIIANTWPEYIINRWSDFKNRPNVIGYVARTDRYGDTHLVGTPNEILLFTLKRSAEDPQINADKICDEFISAKYGEQAIPFLKPAFNLAFDIVTSSLYTLGTNISNHSSMDFDPYISSYGRHVSGKWISPPVVFVKHGINKEFNYWSGIIEHLAPASLKIPEAALEAEAPFVIQNNWVTPKEQMDEIWLRYIITEKHYGVEAAKRALSFVKKAKPVMKSEDFKQVYQLFYRTLLTAQLYEATATAYFGYRVYARGGSFQNSWLKETMQNALGSLLVVGSDIKNYQEKVPQGQWNWFGDTKTADKYYRLITTGWKEYGNVAFPYTNNKLKH